METDVAIIGAGPGGMQAAIELADAGIDAILLDPAPGLPEAPNGCMTVPRRSAVLGEGHCGHPAGARDWSELAECPLHRILIGGRTVVGRWDSPEILGYNFTRGTFWQAMIDAARAAGARIVQGKATVARTEAHGIVIDTTAGTIEAKAAILAAGVRGETSLATSLGLGTPPLVNGIFGDFPFDGEWTSPELSILVNVDLVPHGYFWCAIAPRARRVSIGILNERPVDEGLIWTFIKTGIIPELVDAVPPGIVMERGILGAVSHVDGSSWPVKQVVPRVISIGESAGAIASYIYEGVFESRYQGKVAASVLAAINRDGAWADPRAYARYETAWRQLDEYNLRMSRQQHYAMYHGGSNVVIDAYLKAFNARNKAVMAAMRSNYLEFTNMAKYEMGLFGAIMGNVPLLDKLPVTAHLVASKMQR